MPSTAATLAASSGRQFLRSRRSTSSGQGRLNTVAKSTGVSGASSVRFFNVFNTGSPPSPSGGQPLNLPTLGVTRGSGVGSAPATGGGASVTGPGVTSSPGVSEKGSL